MVAPPPILRPDTLKGIDALIRAGFIAYRETCFNWLLAATGLVVAGLAFEGPELWHEISGISKHWRFRRSFHFSLPEAHTPKSAKLLAFVGWLLIVVGVAGEYVADSFVSRADGYVQTFDELLLTETQNRTALASERASAAYERASENEKETAATLKQAEQERTDAAKSLQAAEAATKEAKGYSLQIAQANERAANLEKDAASARLETEKLKQAVVWRTISPEIASQLETILSAKPGSVNLRYTDGDPEALFLAIQLSRILDKAKWKIAPGALKFANAIQFGIALPDSNGTDANTLREALSAAKIGYSTNPPPPAGISFSVSAIEGAPTLMIGSKWPPAVP